MLHLNDEIQSQKMAEFMKSIYEKEHLKLYITFSCFHLQ